MAQSRSPRPPSWLSLALPGLHPGSVSFSQASILAQSRSPRPPSWLSLVLPGLHPGSVSFSQASILAQSHSPRPPSWLSLTLPGLHPGSVSLSQASILVSYVACKISHTSKSNSCSFLDSLVPAGMRLYYLGSIEPEL